MAMVMEVKCTNGGIGRIYDDYIIKDPEERRKQKQKAYRLACRIWAAAQKREAEKHVRDRGCAGTEAQAGIPKQPEADD